MYSVVASSAEGDQIFLSVAPQPALRLDVVNLEVSRTAAPLATPGVSLQHLLAQLTIGLWVEPEAWTV